MTMNYPRNQESFGLLLSYAADMVFCIDGNSASSVDIAKQVLCGLHSKLFSTLNDKMKPLKELSVKVIVFRDYLTDGEHAMMLTDFFDLPQQTKAFERCVESIKPNGQKSGYGNGLEAISYAIRSDWSDPMTRKRQVIVVMTDGNAHGFDTCNKCDHYPKGMPKNIEELTGWWDNPAMMKQKEKRLVLLAPVSGNWKYLSDNWDMAIHIPIEPKEGFTRKKEEMLYDIASAI